MFKCLIIPINYEFSVYSYMHLNFRTCLKVAGQEIVHNFLLAPRDLTGIKLAVGIILILLPTLLNAQGLRLEGHVKEQDGGNLAFANVLILPDSIVVPADEHGEFSVKVLAGAKEVLISYTGYEMLRTQMDLTQDTTLIFSLLSRTAQLKEVSITANPNEDLFESTRTGTTTLSPKDIMGMPVLGGEADVIKTLQLLPGTLRGVEGSSDIFVRGGAADQNLVLLDGATVYNTSHLFGFFSVFNPDILEKVESVNGGFPAQYGGRLSAVIDISSKNRIARETLVSGNIGLISSRLYIEQPLVKNKVSMWLAGRRTYIDQVVKLIGEELPYFFYDLNGKLIFKPGKQDQFDVSFYNGKDMLNLSQEEDQNRYGFTSTYAVGNSSQAIHWRHQYGHGWDSELALTRTSFQYDIRNMIGMHELIAFSDIEDYGAKMTFQKDSAWNSTSIKTGVEWIRHAVSPNIITSSGFFSDLLESSATGGKTAHEAAVFMEQEWQLSKRLRMNAGMRGSLALLPNKEYFTPEPRLSFRYALRESQSIKLSYSRMAQYMHRVSNSTISSPTDIWYPVTDSIAPQRAHQFSAAWQKMIPTQDIFISAEAYYKTMDNLLGYEEGTSLFLNPDFQSYLIQGQGRAYGLELLLRKDAGRFSGWLSYTLSWSWRQYQEINQGAWFYARYDRRHNGALVLQYSLAKRWDASMVWEFISGGRFTPIIGQYLVPSPTLTGADLIPLYSSINQVKLADSHRLDLGITFKSKPGRKFRWQLFAGINNAYNRASPIGIFIERDENNGSLRYIQPGLFGLLPFINYGFKF